MGVFFRKVLQINAADGGSDCLVKKLKVDDFKKYDEIAVSSDMQLLIVADGAETYIGSGKPTKNVFKKAAMLDLYVVNMRNVTGLWGVGGVPYSERASLLFAGSSKTVEIGMNGDFTMRITDVKSLKKYFSGEITAENVKDAVFNQLTQAAKVALQTLNGIPYTQIISKQSEIAGRIKRDIDLTKKFTNMGLNLINVIVKEIHLPEGYADAPDQNDPVAERDERRRKFMEEIAREEKENKEREFLEGLVNGGKKNEPAKSLKCAKCGFENDADARFCKKCGQKLK